MISNGTGLHITHTGFTILSSLSSHSSQPFTLSNVFCVPSMKKNLVFVSKFCQSNHVSVEFLPFSFVVKDLQTGAPLVKGCNQDRVYEWPSHVTSLTPILAFANLKTSLHQWHNRFGHPSKILQRIVFSN